MATAAIATEVREERQPIVPITEIEQSGLLSNGRNAGGQDPRAGIRGGGQVAEDPDLVPQGGHLKSSTFGSAKPEPLWANSW